MPGTLLHIADRLYGRPLFLHPQKAEVIAAVLGEHSGQRITIDIPQDALPGGGIDASRFTGTRRKPDGQGATLYRQEGGVAIVNVIGSLVNRGAWVDANSGLTSYEGIGAQIKAAGADQDIHTLLLDVDSGGGEATGMFALAGAIRKVAATKRVVAVVNDVAASAAYGIASAAHEIVISPTSIVGSIGVVMLHLDRSAEMAQKGIRATLIHAGAHKVDGHPFGPLSAEVAADLQRDVMTFYDRFLEAVAEGRQGRLTAAAARATEARTFIGADAIKLGLADRMASFDETLDRLSSTTRTTRPSAARASTGARKMDDDMIARADHEKAVKAARDEGFRSGKTEGLAEGEATGKAAGAATELARTKAILGLENAKGREPQAHALIAAGVTPEAADAVLASAPKSNSLASRMSESLPPLGGLTGQEGEKTPSAAWDKHIERQNARLGG